MADLAILTEGLGLSFGPVRAVDELTMEVPAGTLFGFLGPNGSGKTSTIRLLLGLLKPTAGRATVLGYDTCKQGAEVRLRTGALLEQNGLYERLTAEGNLEFYGRVCHMPAGERRARIREMLVHLGLWERRGDLVGTWSRGMKQRLAIARALLHRPQMVFLDEPTAGLDPLAAATLHKDLLSLVKHEGATVFLTTHNLIEAEKLCGRIAVIRQGRLVACGHPDELRARIGGPRAEVVGNGMGEQTLALLRERPEVTAAGLENGRLALTLTDGAPLAPLVSLLVSAGAQVEEVRKGRASLEEVFLTLMTEGKPC